jgi:acetyltransferase-like isoleucine patch superfamily enzyme
MFRLDREELREFRRSGNKIIKKVEFKNDENPARKWYKYKNPIIQAFNYSINLICEKLPPCEFKNFLYRRTGMLIGKNVSIANDCIIDTIFPELIRIDDNVMIGWGCKLYTHEFTLNSAMIGTIHFKSNSMLGEWSVVRPGIVFGSQSMVAAMSFVNRDVPDGLLEGGVPIHIIHYARKAPKRSNLKAK